MKQKIKKNKKGKTSSTSEYTVPSQRKTKEILRDLHTGKSFYFYQDIGKPTGQVATSLLDFCSKLASADIATRASVVFHAKRGDFTAWIREAVGDPELASKVSQINPNDEHLVEKLRKTVNERIKQLKQTVVEYTIIPEDSAISANLELEH